jgi:hypothetical protein
LTGLGWDVAHNDQHNPFEQEVHVEQNVDMGHSQKRADYPFFVRPNFRDVRFYVEAKKPTLVLESSDNYFQAIRYGWNSGTSVAFLTDFESLHVLDCRYKPNIDTAKECVVEKFTTQNIGTVTGLHALAAGFGLRRFFGLNDRARGLLHHVESDLCEVFARHQKDLRIMSANNSRGVRLASREANGLISQATSSI